MTKYKIQRTGFAIFLKTLECYEVSGFVMFPNKRVKVTPSV